MGSCSNTEVKTAENENSNADGIYLNVSPDFQAGPLRDLSRCLKANKIDAGVVLYDEPRVVGGVGEKNFGNQYRQGNRIYDSETVACALNAQPVGNAGGYSYLYAIKEEPIIGAIRGRNPDNPSDRTAGIQTTQRLEIGGNVSNTITTVQKDNVVLEPNVRVRKLTPKECWRLMGFDDEAFERAAKVNSNSQLYKQAGNSIVVNVLEAIFKEMIDNGEQSKEAEHI